MFFATRGRRYEQAIADLESIIDDLDTDDERLLTAYLYLGRSYEALGDYVAAAEAYSNGRILGGGVRFEEHLALVQQHLRSSPRAIQSQKRITRAQLASLIVRLGGAAAEEAVDAPDMRNHWAREYAGYVVDRGIMPLMADGGFHPEDEVTRAALYITLLRADGSFAIKRDELNVHFPGGYTETLQMKDAFVSGYDATEIVRTVLTSPTTGVE
jgi:tetratricopeptide (TPR) repeat protein